jgi:hypothetical protein
LQTSFTAYKSKERELIKLRESISRSIAGELINTITVHPDTNIRKAVHI